MKKKERNSIPACPESAVKYDAAAEKAENIIGLRISEARRKKGMSIAAFSAYLENFGVRITTGGAGKWETGDSVPNAYQLIAICCALGMEDQLPFFISNYEPLLNETGMMKLNDYRSDLIASGRYSPKKAEIIRFRDIPVSELGASAGTGQFLDEGRFEPVSFPEDKIPQGADFGVYVLGNSMEPVYHDGQIVFVHICDKVEPGQVGIFVHDGEGFIKIYSEQQPDESLLDEFTDSYGVVHPQPVLRSYNAKYPPRVIHPSDQFEVIGRVL